MDDEVSATPKDESESGDLQGDVSCDFDVDEMNIIISSQIMKLRLGLALELEFHKILNINI